MNPKLKKWATIGLVLYAVNKCFIPFASSSTMDVIKDPQIQSCMKTERYVHNYGCRMPQDEALKQLKLAHAVTMKYLNLGDPSFADYGLPVKEFLDKKIGDCSETSRFTYSNYLFFINKIGRSELSDYVRLANGSAYGVGHAWVEIKQNGIWIPYETTRNDLYKDYSINPKSIDRIVRSEEVLNAEKGYNRVDTHQIDKEGKIHHDIEVIGAIKEPGLLLQAWRMFLRSK